MSIQRSMILTPLILAGLLSTAAADSLQEVQQRMFFRNQIKDATGCGLQVDGTTATVTQHGTPLTAGPLTCPDAFAWAQFAEALDNQFWTWATDPTMWPKDPWPLCTEHNAPNCCPLPHSLKPAEFPPGQHCPVFAPGYDLYFDVLIADNQTGIPAAPILGHSGLESIDPGRFLRDFEVEVVYRNPAFFDYVYHNELYSKAGLGKRFKAQAEALSPSEDGTIELGRAQSLRISFPVDAVMVKVDFVSGKYMQELGLLPDVVDGVPNNKDYPYVVFQPDPTKSGKPEDYYYLLAMTNASKDLPNWHWYAIEHVANLGRCDYTGCNDSFGYTVTSEQQNAGFGDHFIAPHIDTDTGTPDVLYITGKTYLPDQTGETITDALRQFFAEMNIGQGSAPTDLTRLHSSDPAWMNYRLKGTQTGFTYPDGIPTGLGASITEGGFVNSASCMTCHAQAAVDAEGNVPTPVGGTWLNDALGFGVTAMGSPEGSMFYNFGGPSLSAMQVDFVWGILGAQ